ncbi:hypothetical protein ACIODS_12080 [Micromonospora chalcea]|uniref:hypothetical protein n=1 Tax=Micromonospora chalcea TaxID=1874 RepID=UPI003819D62B
MSSMYDELGASPAVTVAASIEQAHQADRPSPGCDECTPDGCPRLVWASKVLAEHRAERAEFLGRGRA